MNAKVVALARPSEINISGVLEKFLGDQRTRLAPRTLARYEDVLDVLRSYLDGYAHESPSVVPWAAFESHGAFSKWQTCTRHEANGGVRIECDDGAPLVQPGRVGGARRCIPRAARKRALDVMLMAVPR